MQELKHVSLFLNYRFLIGQYVTVHGEVVSHVNISRVEVEDGGLYACIVDNRAGTAKHEGRLNIYGKLTRLNAFEKKMSFGTVTETETVM